MSRKQDLHNLGGDPFDEDKSFIDRPDPRIIEERREALHSAIHSLPRGSLSGGIDVFDPSDIKGTLWASDNPADRAFAKDFLGVAPELGTVPEGLSIGQKRALLDLADSEVDAISAKDLRREAADNAAFEKAATGLWGQYSLMYPDNASWPDDARQAMQRLVSGSRLSKRELADLAEKRPDDLLTMIAIEQENPGYHHERYGIHKPTPQPLVDHSTTSISGGGGGSYRRAPREDTEPGSSFDGVVPYGQDRRYGNR